MEHLDHPSHPISMVPKWRVFAPSRLHHCFWGEGGVYSVQDCISFLNNPVAFTFQFVLILCPVIVTLNSNWFSRWNHLLWVLWLLV